MAATTAETGAPPPEGGNFPPFDATTFVPQLFWLAVAFTLLYVMLERMALPGIEKALKDRRARIVDDLDTAEQLRKDASDVLAAYETAMAEARSQAARIGAEAYAAIKAESAKRRGEVDAELGRMVEAAEEQIEEAKKRAIADVRGVAIEVAGVIVQKVLNEPASPDEIARFVDEDLRAA